MVEPVQQFDVISMGRIGIDLYPHRPGAPTAQDRPLGPVLRGSAAHVAVTAARLGRSSAVIARTGADRLGAYLHQTLTECGVDDRWVTPAACPAPGAEPSGLEIHTDELDCFAIRAARLFWITGTGLGAEPSRSATLAALKCRDRTGTTVLELDRRPARWTGTAWGDPEEARPYRAEALRHATVAVGDLDECETVTGARGPRACAEALLAAGVELAVVRQGPSGVLAVHRDGTTVEVPPVPQDMADGPGAGDAFGGSLCHGLLSGWEPERTVRYAHAGGAPQAARPARSPALPAQAAAGGLLNGVST
ncbi:PfkB family carbohydrate kinase [Streptomyces sp. NPDC093990]|uniref:PfkB family carbohydrate kinase n=1 Tax=Streptomyces sp. NPDC093990 TaxID=3155306 RepID=UPI00343ADEB9